MSFAALALVVAAGLVGPVLASARRTAPPVVIGEILAGVAIGHSGLRWIDPAQPVLAGLAQIGFALLMFVVGTHLPLRDPTLPSVLGRGALLTVTGGGLAVAAGLAVARLSDLHRPAVLAVLIAASSAAVALPVLHDLGRTDRQVLTTTAWIALADALTVLAVPLVMARGSVLRVLMGGGLVVGAATVLYAAARLVAGWPRVQWARHQSHQRGWALDLRVSLLALFALAWVATRFGTSVLVAGFAAGAAVALLGEPRRVAQQLVGLGEGFAIPLFFVHLGAQLDLGAMFRSSGSLALAGLLAGASVAVHVVAAVVWRLPLGAGLVAAAQLGVPAAVVSVGLGTGALTPGQGAAVLAAALVSLVAAAVGSARLGVQAPVTDAAAPIPGRRGAT